VNPVGCFVVGSLLVIIVAALLLFIAQAARAQDIAAPPTYYPSGSLAGTGLWDCYLCDVLGVRNIQGGKHTGDPYDLNLDIGAGSTEHPGHIIFNFDVGKCVHIFNGLKSRVASFCPRKIVFFRKVFFR
jgi:hypothetical protein